MKKYLLPFLHGLISPLGFAKADGLMGAEIENAQAKHDLFVFFNFEPIQTETGAADPQVISYKPTGEAFRALVTLQVTVGNFGKIRRLQLEIARLFIDDRAKGIYAADLAKSFLLAAATTSAGDEIQALAAEIRARAQAGSSVPILTRQSVPPVSRTPSRAYQTYAGDLTPTTLDYPGGWQLRLRNVEEEGSRVLSMTVGSET